MRSGLGFFHFWKPNFEVPVKEPDFKKKKKNLSLPTKNQNALKRFQKDSMVPGQVLEL